MPFVDYGKDKIHFDEKKNFENKRAKTDGNTKSEPSLFGLKKNQHQSKLRQVTFKETN